MANFPFWIEECCKWFHKPRLDSLVLYVTSRCNAGCDFCCYHNNLNQGTEPTADELKTVAQKLGHLRGLLIAGGEPFLRQDLADIVQNFIHYSQTRVVQIPTNGYFPERAVECTKNILENNPTVNLSIQVSLDAIGEKHNELRHLKDGFSRAEETIRRLAGLKRPGNGLRILVVSVLGPQTLPYFRELALYVRDRIKPDYHWFEPVRGPHAHALATKITQEDLMSLRKNLEHYLYGISGKSSSIYASRIMNKMIASFSLGNFDIAYANLLSSRKWPATCCAGQRMAVLYPDGSLAPCELLQDRIDLRENSWDIPKIFQDHSFAKSRDKISGHGCDCTHGCFIPTSIRYSPTELIKIFVKSLVLKRNKR